MALAAAIVVDALAALLVGQALGPGGVTTDRLHPWAEADLPACKVLPADESCELADVGGLYQHDLSVNAEYSARAVAALDDTLHGLAEAGLARLFAGVPPYGLQLEGISRSLATEGEAAVGRITLRLRCIYFVNPAAPGTIVS
jgi:hypothetical protein